MSKVVGEVMVAKEVCGWGSLFKASCNGDLFAKAVGSTLYLRICRRVQVVFNNIKFQQRGTETLNKKAFDAR